MYEVIELKNINVNINLLKYYIKYDIIKLLTIDKNIINNTENMLIIDNNDNNVNYIVIDYYENVKNIIIAQSNKW